MTRSLPYAPLLTQRIAAVADRCRVLAAVRDGAVRSLRAGARLVLRLLGCEAWVRPLRRLRTDADRAHDAMVAWLDDLLAGVSAAQATAEARCWPYTVASAYATRTGGGER